jgi:hypothetical protein
MILTPFRPRRCAVCQKQYMPMQSMQKVCGVPCAKRLVKAKKAQDKRSLRERKEALKSRREWLDDCQAIVNKIARLRDRDDGCISCTKGPNWKGQWHGSHYRSVGAASAIRLNLLNIHKACSECNHHKSGNIAEYRPRLIAKVGQDKVDWLESQNQLVRYDVDYLKRFKAVMGKKLRRMEKRIEA